MKFMKKIKKFFLTNWVAKLIILLVTAALWAFVASTQSTIGKFPTTIEIKTINVPTGYSAIYDQDTVSLKIMAEPSAWRALSTQSFSAYIDLSNLEEGTYELPVSVTTSVKDVQIVQRDPERIMVRVEKNISKMVPISARVEGSAAEGMISGDATFNAKEASVSGPESIVNKITEAVAVVRINGESSDFKKTVRLTALDENGDLYQSIVFNPTEVEIDLKIIKASNNKTVGIKVKTTGIPKDGFYISKITVDPQTVNIIGPLANLANISSIDTAEIDVSALEKSITRDVALRPQTGTALQKDQPTTVKVTITVSESDISRQMPVKVTFIGLDPTLRIVSQDPVETKAIVSGSSALISQLTVNDILLTIDLTGKVAGKNTINLDSSQLQLKPGLSLVNLVPGSISLQIDNR